MTRAARRGLSQDFLHEVGPIDTRNAAPALKPAHPDHRHAVRRAKKSVVEDLAERFIALSFHHAVNASHANVALRAPANRVEHRSEEHTSELQSQSNLVCRLLLEKKKKKKQK